MNRTALITLGVLAAAVVAVVVLKNKTAPVAPAPAKGLAQVAAAVAAQKASPGTAATTTSVKPAIVAAPIGTGLARVVDMSAFASSEPMGTKGVATGSIESIFSTTKYLY
jgi:hypothetical protein